MEAIEKFTSIDDTVTVTAVGDTISATITTRHARLRVVRHVDWFVADVGEHTMSPTARQLKDRRYRISESAGWHTSTDHCTPARKASRTVLSQAAISGSVNTGSFSDQLTVLVGSPAVANIQLAATAVGAIGLSTRSPIIASAVSTGPVDDTAAAVSLPAELAAALAVLVADEPADRPLTVTVDPAKATISAATSDTTITITARTAEPAGPWPTRPEPDLQRHDLIVTDLTDWHALTDHPVTTPPFPTAHLRWDAPTGLLTVLARIGTTTVDLGLPATSSDRFAVDVPWPALHALLAGAGHADQAGLRYFEPNPTLTFLIADYRVGEFAGFATVGARRPDNRLNGGFSATGH
ncbi:hypothetical protein UG54_00420 [Gordonia sihwensis]|nr:hypothetical protein UG54_00420 [Gordonia sihwensis]